MRRASPLARRSASLALVFEPASADHGVSRHVKNGRDVSGGTLWIARTAHTRFPGARDKNRHAAARGFLEARGRVFSRSAAMRVHLLSVDNRFGWVMFKTGHQPRKRSESSGRRSPPACARWAQDPQSRIHRSRAALPGPRRRRERLLDIALQVAPLQPPHQDRRQAREAAVRIAFTPKNVSASRQISWIRSRQQPGERVETRGIEGLYHRHTPSTTIRV